MAISKMQPTQRELNAMETKEKIFRTALSLFSQYGFNKVTVEDITRFAGFSKGTFYAYFPSKESVLLEQFRKIDARYEEVFRDIPETASGSERVMTLIKTMCDYCINVVGMAPLQIIYANQITSPDTIQILNTNDRTMYRIMRESIDRGKTSGEFPRRIETDELTKFMIHSVRGLIYDWCIYNSSFDLEAEGTKYFSNILYLLGLAAKDEQTSTDM